MALTNKLSAIGDAIREKTGDTELMTLDAMPAAIRGIETGGGGTEVEPIVLTGNGQYACAGTVASAHIRLFGNKVSTKDLGNTPYMFFNYENEEIPFDLNYDNSSGGHSLAYAFQHSSLKTFPKFNNCKPNEVSYAFSNCQELESLPEDFGDQFDWQHIDNATASYYRHSHCMFSGCYRLRNIPFSFINHSNPTLNTIYYCLYYDLCCNCYSLDSLKLPVRNPDISGNAFGSAFNAPYSLKELTFDVNEDGSPKTANWKQFIIDLTQAGFFPGTYYSNFTNFTTATLIKDADTYEAFKDHPDAWTADINYSHFNHDSAVNFINTLPNVTTGSNNTIKFKGAAGSATDGGAISNLTEEEIAVAAARGWTITLS